MAEQKQENPPIFIKNGTVVNADRSFKANVICQDGIIKAVGEDVAPLSLDGFRVIDAEGMYVMPAGIDPHTHMQLPFMGEVSRDDFENGTRAAITGGTGTILDFVIPAVGKSLVGELEKWMGWAEKSVCDYSFHVSVTWWDDEKTEGEMTKIVKEYGVNSFKHFLAYKGAIMLNDEEIVKSFTVAKRLGALCSCHCENGELVWALTQKLLKMGITGPEGHPQSRPPHVEAEATNRVAKIAQSINNPLYIVHCSCKDSLDAIAAAKMSGQRIWGESLIGHLTIDDSKYYDKDWSIAAAHVMSPPFRSKEHQEALWRGLKAGVISTVATDHCPFVVKQKALGRDNFAKIPNGCAGVEERMPVLWQLGVNSGRLTMSEFVTVSSTNAARVFNLYPKKGVVQVGSDADIAVWNPTLSKVISAKTHVSNVDVSVFEGMKVKGLPQYTLVRGKVVYEHGKGTTVERGYGKRLIRPPFSPMLFDKLDQNDEVKKPIKVERE